MADALYMIALGVITLIFGAKGFFGGVFILGGLCVLRIVLGSRIGRSKKILPGKSLRIEVESEDEKIRLVVPLMILELMKPALMASSSLIESVIVKRVKDERLKGMDISKLIGTISNFVDVLYAFEGDLLYLEGPDERIRIYLA